MEGDVFQVSEDLKEKDLNLQSDEPGDFYFCIYNLVLSHEIWGKYMF